ncbi:MAG: oligosaccharide flippase family protein [Deltaproteobacteria bacterium]|nr:oligosaccharide flippase family protein [Deltaproteobacteria bacterium]
MSEIKLKGVGQNLLSNLTISFFNMFTGIVTARLLGATGKGELTTVMLWPLIFETLGLFGTNWSIARCVAENKKKINDLARSSLTTCFMLAVLTVVFGYITIPKLIPADKQHLVTLSRCFLIYIPIMFIIRCFLAINQGSMLWKRFNILRLSFYFPYLLILSLLWLKKVNQVEWFLSALIIAYFVQALLSISFHLREIAKGSSGMSNIKSILRRGFPFSIYNVGMVIAQEIDKALLVLLLSSTEVGLYAVAFSFGSTHGALGSAFGITSFAVLASESDPGRRGQFIAKAFRQATLLYVGVGIAVAFLAPYMIVILFGPQFAPARQPAIILALANSLIYLGSILDEGFRGTGNTVPGILAKFIGGGIVAIFALLLAPKIGIMGMAWAFFLGSLGQLIFMTCFVKYYFNLKLSHLWGIRFSEANDLIGSFLAHFPKLSSIKLP